MLSYKEWLQIILDRSAIIYLGESHPAHEIYTPEMIDAEDSEYLYWMYKDNVSAGVFTATSNGETWGIV